MKVSAVVLCMAMLAVFALAGCGSGNNATSNSAGSGNSTETKADTPADKRQAVVDKMVAANNALDGDAVVKLFAKDEQDLAEKRIAKDLREIKDGGGTYKVTAKPVEEKDGKFFVTFHSKVEMKDENDEGDHTLSLIEKDGTWYLSFPK